MPGASFAMMREFPFYVVEKAPHVVLLAPHHERRDFLLVCLW
jgi:hypothetical protein